MNYFNTKLSFSTCLSIRDAILTFDAMAVQPSIRYSESEDEIKGLEGGSGEDEKGEGMANQMLVFMLRGTHARWKQPIGYFMVSHSLTRERYMELIIEGLHVSHVAGVNVSA